MKKVVWLSNNDMPQWDALVADHPFGWICHLSTWKYVLENSFTHIKGNILALWDNDAEKIVGGLPVYFVRSSLTGNRLVSIPYATLCDPLITSQDEMDLILPPLVDFKKQVGAKHIELRSFLSAEFITIPSFGIMQNYKNHYLSLDSELDTIMQSFHPTSVRYNIRKAAKNNIVIKEAEDETSLQKFYRLYFITRKQLGLPPMPFRFFRSLWKNYANSKWVIFLIAELDHQPIAAAMVFKYKNKMSIDYLGWDRKYKNVKPSVYIYWEAIKLAYDNGCKIFDFGRTEISNKNLMDFKGRWGTKVRNLIEFYYPKTNSEISKYKKSSLSYKLVKKVSKRSPDFVFKLIGNFCYRHLG